MSQNGIKDIYACVLPYSTKFSRVFNFANFAKFQKYFLTRSMQFARAVDSWNYFNEMLKNHYS